MNYELAKELKEAGFPQDAEWSRGFWDWPNRLKTATDYSMPDFQWSPENAQQPDYCYFPTLSELIEACGTVGFYLSENGAGKWSANNAAGSIGNSTGATPEEAVARLWLALKKK